MCFSKLRLCLVAASLCMLRPLSGTAQEPAVPDDWTWVSFEVPGAFETIPQSINNSMIVTGTYTYQDAPGEGGFVRNADGVITTFLVPNSSVTIPVAINAAGKIAGEFYDQATHNFAGFVRGAYGAITTFTPNPSDSIDVTGIGADGTIVGYGSGDQVGSLGYAFILHLDGVVVKFHVPGSKQTVPEGINAAGEVTGYFLISEAKDTYAAFVRSPDGTIKTFDVYGGFQTMPVGINAKGVVAGSVLSSQTAFGFLRYADGGTDAFTIPNAMTIPSSINAGRAITGTFSGPSEFNSHGFLRSEAGTFTSFDFPGGTYTQPVSINDSGVMTGSYIKGNGVKSFLLIPRAPTT